MKVKTYIVKDPDTGNFYEYNDKKQMERDLKEIFHGAEVIESSNNIAYYIEISLLNKKGQEFEKGFNDVHRAIAFLNKARRGNSLVITSISCPSSSVQQKLEYYSKELEKWKLHSEIIMEKHNLS